MPSILALSVTDKIEQYGAYAGFAAVLGLAILSLLYFAQAREVKRLREWAGRAPERAAEVQAGVQTEAQRRVVAQPQAQPKPATAQPAAATPAGAAAQGAATAAAAAATAAGAAAKAAGTTAPPPGVGQQPTTVQPAATPGNGTPPVPPAKPGEPLRMPSASPSPAAAGAGAGTPPGPRTAATPAGATTARAQAAAAADRGEDRDGRRLLPIFGAAGAVAAVVVALLFVFGVLGGDGGTPEKPNQIAPAPAPDSGGSKASNAPAAATPRSQTTVAVLNGTTIPGLARGVGTKLQKDGWRLGNVTNATDQTRSATLVLYAPGHKAQALAVAKGIGLGSDVVGAVDSGNRLIAGDEADVVVVVGADQQPQ